MSEGFEPRIVAFFCNWCTYTAADLAGISRMKYSPNVHIIRVMCSGRVIRSSSWMPLQKEQMGSLWEDVILEIVTI